MKKTIRILALALIIVMLMVSFAGCFMMRPKKEVTLIGCSASTEAPSKSDTIAMTAKDVPCLLSSNPASMVPRLLAASPDEAESTTPETTEVTTAAETTAEIVEDDPYSTFTVIYKTQTVIYFTINLSNPNNRYIMDFKLSCAEDPNVTVRQGRHESRINDPNTYIRWDEAEDRIGNHQATFILTLPNADVSPTSIRISEMYYSDRIDGTNKTTVNMNNRDVYTIYKTDSLVETTARRNSLEYFEFGLNVNENATVTSVKVDGMDQTANGEGKYQIPSGKLVIEYDFETSDGRTYKGSYEEDIEVLSFRHNGDTIDKVPLKVEYSEDGFTLHYSISGTDFLSPDGRNVNIRIANQITRYAHLESDGCIYIGAAEGDDYGYKPGLTLIICSTEFVVADTFE